MTSLSAYLKNEEKSASSETITEFKNKYQLIRTPTFYLLPVEAKISPYNQKKTHGFIDEIISPYFLSVAGTDPDKDDCCFVYLDNKTNEKLLIHPAVSIMPVKAGDCVDLTSYTSIASAYKQYHDLYSSNLPYFMSRVVFCPNAEGSFVLNSLTDKASANETKGGIINKDELDDFCIEFLHTIESTKKYFYTRCLFNLGVLSSIVSSDPRYTVRDTNNSFYPYPYRNPLSLIVSSVPIVTSLAFASKIFIDTNTDVLLRVLNDYGCFLLTNSVFNHLSSDAFSDTPFKIQQRSNRDTSDWDNVFNVVVKRKHLKRNNSGHKLSQDTIIKRRDAKAVKHITAGLIPRRWMVDFENVVNKFRHAFFGELTFSRYGRITVYSPYFNEHSLSKNEYLTYTKNRKKYKNTIVLKPSDQQYSLVVRYKKKQLEYGYYFRTCFDGRLANLYEGPSLTDEQRHALLSMLRKNSKYRELLTEVKPYLFNLYKAFHSPTILEKLNIQNNDDRLPLIFNTIVCLSKEIRTLKL